MLSGWVLLSIIRSTISGFSVGNHGELTHGHARAVIGVDTGVTYSDEFFIDTFGSIVGSVLCSGSIVGELTHGHARAVIGVDTGVRTPANFSLTHSGLSSAMCSAVGLSSEVRSPAGSFPFHECPSFG